MGRGLWNIAYGAAAIATAALMLPVLAGAALRARLATRGRKRRGDRPRLLWGPEPLISIKYWSAAMRERGYDSVTCVYAVYPSNDRSDFDVHRDEFAGGAPELIRDYAVFAWALRRADVVLTSFDGGFLRGTPLRSLECALLHLAGKSVVVSPYGSDIAVLGEVGWGEDRLLLDYPAIAERSAAVRKRVDHFSRRADVIVRNHQFGYLPRADVVWPTHFTIDEVPEADAGVPGSREGEVVVLHAPNHRHIKGTDELIAAVDSLASEGLPVRLNLIEGASHPEVRAAIAGADIVADQFVYGYAMFAIEGLAAGRPVMSAISHMPAEARGAASMRDCPIVDSDVHSVREDLRALLGDRAGLARLGRESRGFYRRYHSFDGVGRGWEAILDHVWNGAELPPELPPA